MKNVFNFILGLLAALIISFIFGCVLFYFFTGKMNPIENLAILNYPDIASKAFSIGSIPNIGLFYLFLNKGNYHSARGVIFSFLLIALYIVLG